MSQVVANTIGKEHSSTIANIIKIAVFGICYKILLYYNYIAKMARYKLNTSQFLTLVSNK